jgi:hypothetical protein
MILIDQTHNFNGYISDIKKTYNTCPNCGKIRNTNLKRSGKKCLSCATDTRGSRNGNYKGTANIPSLTYSRWKRGRKRGTRILEWNITIQDVEDLFIKQEGKCALSGILMDKNKNSQYKMSLDRKDPKLGYVLGNIQLVCNVVNTMKMKLNDQEFLNLVSKIYKNGI